MVLQRPLFRNERISGSEICQYPEQSVNQCKNDRTYSTPGVPFERYCADPLQGHDSDQGSEQECEQGKDPQIHDQGFSEDQKVGDILEHGSCLHGDGPLHKRVDQAGIIEGTCTVEYLAERLACTKEEGRCGKCLVSKPDPVRVVICIYPPDGRTDLHGHVCRRLKRIFYNRDGIIRH